MKFGLFAINSGICADPDVAGEIAQAAEAAGRVCRRLAFGGNVGGRRR